MDGLQEPCGWFGRLQVAVESGIGQKRTVTDDCFREGSMVPDRLRSAEQSATIAIVGRRRQSQVRGIDT